MLPYLIGTFGAVCLALTVGFCVGVAYGARLQAAKDATEERTRASQPPLMEPKLWPAGQIAVAMNEQSGRSPIDVPRTYQANGSHIPSIPGLD